MSSRNRPMTEHEILYEIIAQQAEAIHIAKDAYEAAVKLAATWEIENKDLRAKIAELEGKTK